MCNYSGNKSSHTIIATKNLLKIGTTFHHQQCGCPQRCHWKQFTKNQDTFCCNQLCLPTISMYIWSVVNVTLPYVYKIIINLAVKIKWGCQDLEIEVPSTKNTKHATSSLYRQACLHISLQRKSCLLAWWSIESQQFVLSPFEQSSGSWLAQMSVLLSEMNTVQSRSSLIFQIQVEFTTRSVKWNQPPLVQSILSRPSGAAAKQEFCN